MKGRCWGDCPGGRKRKSREQIGTVGGKKKDRRINRKINEFGSVYGDEGGQMSLCVWCHKPSRRRGVGENLPGGWAAACRESIRDWSTQPHDADIDNSRATNIWTCSTHG